MGGKKTKSRYLQWPTCLDNHLLSIVTTLQLCLASKPVCSPEKDLHKSFCWHLSKTTSFLVSQIDHQKVIASVNNCKFGFCPPYFNHWWNKSSKFDGGGIPKTLCTARHRNLVYAQSKKICWIVSSAQQKLHVLLPFKFLLARLSFVSTAPCFKYHIYILIFNGNLSCQISPVTLMPLLIMCLYMKHI